MSKLEFLVELPIRRRSINRHDWKDIVKQCRAHVGKWTDAFQLGINTAPTYYYMKARSFGLEVTTHRQDGQVHVYLRWPK